MLLFKLSVKNLQKSIKDYAIYFLTLVLGVAVFYMFNSIDSQQAMLEVSKSTKEIIGLMISMMGMVSVFVAVVLGLLIVYANNFLINRRKKEFGIYMTLGMGKRQISRIILMETVFVGLISLAFGLMVGIFASQFMSILVAKLFEADMSGFTFVFSKDACIKTGICFAIMYAAVMVFSAFTVSRYRLIDLIYAEKKSEKVRMKNPFLSLLVFAVACGILGYAYQLVTTRESGLTDAKLLQAVLMGILGTVLVFWSLSGFILQLVQRVRRLYLKDTNMFVLRQINNKINTNVISMSVICLMLFLTITALSSSLAMRNSMQAALVELTPVDVNLYKTANLFETEETSYTKEQIADSRVSIQETLEKNGFDLGLLTDIEEISIYTQEGLTWETFFGDVMEEAREKYPYMNYGTEETIVKLSDYNRIAGLYGQQTYELNEDEYLVLCTFDSIKSLSEQALMDGNPLEIAGKIYRSRYAECQDGFLTMSTTDTNLGILVVPDSCPLTEADRAQYLLAANYNAQTDEEKAQIEALFADDSSELNQTLNQKGIELDGITKIALYESSIGVTTIIIFIAIYLGIIFLIASAAILALKQLTESSDNRQRYAVLRKIGCEERMIYRTLFIQIGIFFAMPLLLAGVHAVFGIQCVFLLLEGVTRADDLLPSVAATVIIMGAIYGAYFLATYLGSKTIVKEEA